MWGRDSKGGKGPSLSASPETTSGGMFQRNVSLRTVGAQKDEAEAASSPGSPQRSGSASGVTKRSLWGSLRSKDKKPPTLPISSGAAHPPPEA